MLQVPGACGRKPVGPDAAVRGGYAPFGFHQVFLEKALERRIERPFLDLKQLVGSLFDVLDEGITV